MASDPIVEEVRHVREALAAEFGYDLRALVASLREEDARLGRQTVRLAPKRLPGSDNEAERGKVDAR